jgi:UDPglucose 6-dehydrogenase
MRLAVVGNGYVGTVTATSLAWLGHDVMGLEEHWVRASQLASGQLPFYEPGLPELLGETLATGRLSFTSVSEVALRNAEAVLICVGTPPRPDGFPDVRRVEDAARTIAGHLTDGIVVVIKSTVSPGTGERIRTILQPSQRLPEQSFSVVSNPEFLREGSAITDFLFPDRIVVGGDRTGVERVVEIYRPVLEQSFPGGNQERRPRLMATDLVSAELAKYAANAFLATKISFANEIANLCELLGADVRQVLPAVGADRRIGRSFLGAGLGWGGSCFPKDLIALIEMGRGGGYDPKLLRAVVDVNRDRIGRFVDKLHSSLGGTAARRLGVLGLAFKPGTDDLREAPALELIRRLIDLGAEVVAYDPVVKEVPREVGALRITASPYEAAEDADALVVATEWPQFAELDFHAIHARMNGNIVLDGRNFLDADRLREAGLLLLGSGWSG